MRPRHVQPVSLAAALGGLDAALPAVTVDGAPVRDSALASLQVTGVAVDSRAAAPGDLYIAVPGAQRHGAEFTAQAAAGGAVAVLTDAEGAARIGAGPNPSALPVLVAERPRLLVGPLSAAVFASQPADAARPVLFGVTGTNGKTTTTYFINALLRALGRTTGLIGTIEILAGAEAIPSTLTTPESPQVHSLLALMRERGLGAAAMEVSSHALEYGRVDGVVFDVAGFTNLTQDHLDLHGDMESYFAVKASLFGAGRSRVGVVTVDDDWGTRMAAAATGPVVTLRTDPDAPAGSPADWTVESIEPAGLGHRFTLRGPGGTALTLSSGLPGTFNVSNAALAAVMVLASGVDPEDLQRAAAAHDPFTVQVPGRMQLISDAPTGIVDFAHNPDALVRTLAAVRRPDPGSRVIIVFGATGQRDETKRPIMGAAAARLADVVIVTDDDPHDEDEAQIRRGVLDGALAAVRAESLACEVLEVFPRAEAIEAAVAMAGEQDTVLVAGRGHEVWQEIKGVNHALDDRVELAASLTRHGFSVRTPVAIES
ncbi:MAG: UDP-N-acetylmuramoylalanyl-D-glutamate--L-lysine ligase [uncultured Arthrobacter sp.]|uniref:UDP-N-acetylmuramyl-tripeptide synthetase n=1 Tax=uncultured Arthrobacter sp. TaxID=114050 RepID=A0A6J4IBV9_9MICC|nr:UDP-N-acetylmuramoyl-L-alanyl-D-glutamate--2,6-diaminopimelate ligase [uncultured Arthrobacter sp.]CAA9248271.1 MAG: UDP-N-acetylmuramoylalanyl-D-glutamate--L-lysine ligase [uncultured Arthrobacter sp.]